MIAIARNAATGIKSTTLKSHRNMNKIKISQDFDLGRVLTDEEMKQIPINGKTSASNYNCVCFLHLVGVKKALPILSVDEMPYC